MIFVRTKQISILYLQRKISEIDLIECKLFCWNVNNFMFIECNNTDLKIVYKWIVILY